MTVANKAATWTTQDGREIEIQWMQTSHLVHSFNMILRNNGLSRETVTRYVGRTHPVIASMVREIRTRGCYSWRPDDTLVTVNVRETPVQLCMLRAIIDSGDDPRIPVTDYLRNMDWYVNTITKRPNEYPRIITKFAEYRLEYKGLA